MRKIIIFLILVLIITFAVLVPTTMKMLTWTALLFVFFSFVYFIIKEGLPDLEKMITRLELYFKKKEQLANRKLKNIKKKPANKPQSGKPKQS